jgi:hypothetical protein
MNGTSSELVSLLMQVQASKAKAAGILYVCPFLLGTVGREGIEASFLHMASLLSLVVPVTGFSSWS